MSSVALERLSQTLELIVAYMRVIWLWFDRNILSVDTDLEAFARLFPTSPRVLAYRRKKYAADGFVLLPGAVPVAELEPLRAEVEAARGQLAKGGYRIWSPVDQLPDALREWSETKGVAIVQATLPPGASELRCIGGAALLKLPDGPGNEGTPFHQDEAYAAETEAPSKRACALWLALSKADSRSGCMRFAPSLGFGLLPHTTEPRDSAPSGFETFLASGSKAAAAAEREAFGVPVSAGDAIIIGGRVVHGSYPARTAERVAFSPLYEWE